MEGKQEKIEAAYVQVEENKKSERIKMTVEENLKKLNLSIPIAPDPVGNYAAYVKSNNLIFI